MSFEENYTKRSGENQGDVRDGQSGKDAEPNAEPDTEMAQALGNFRLSVKAWSDAEFSRPRAVVAAAHRRSWRRAAAWALGCVLVAGGVSGGLIDRQLQEHRVEQARVKALADAAQQRALTAQRARPADPEQELAKVDSEVAREAPSAMEPLAQLMGEDDTQ